MVTINILGEIKNLKREIKSLKSENDSLTKKSQSSGGVNQKVIPNNFYCYIIYNI